VLVVAVLVTAPIAAFSAEFIANGALLRAAAGGNWCESGSNAFGCWTLTPDNGGGTNYSADEFWPDTRLCGCSGVPCQIYPEISQSFGISGGGAYTLTWDQRNDQEACSSRTSMWGAMTAIGTVYYYKDAAMSVPCTPPYEDTGNVTSQTQGVWAPISLSNTGNAPLHGTAPADCRYVRVAIKGLAKTNTCTATSGTVHAWTEIRNVSFTSNAFTKTTGPDPMITAQPTSKLATVGDQVTFSVTAHGPGAVAFQWQKKPSGGSFASIAGATSSTYTTPVLSAGDTGTQYRCAVSNVCTTIYSDAASLTVYAPLSLASIVDAKDCPDGTLVKLTNKPVSVRTSSAYWVQDDVVPCGIKVASAAYPAPGSRVTITGTLGTTARERWISPVVETWGVPGDPVKPFFMTTRSLGGADLGVFSPGVPDAGGANNIGLFVKIYGTVKNVAGSYYYVDDGAALADGTAPGNLGVRVMAAPGGLAKDDTTAVSGASSTFVDGASNVHRAIVTSGCTMPITTLTVGASDTTLCGGMSTSISVASSETDVSYQLRNSAGNTLVGSPVVGSGGTILLPTGPLSATTTFNVLATRNVGGCSQQLAQTKTITVNPLPSAGLAVGATQAQIEPGESTSITVAGSQVGVNYQLRKNVDNSNVGSPVAGTGGTILLPTGTLSSAENIVYNVMATNATTGCGQQLTQTVMIVIGHTGTITGLVKNALAQPIAGATVTLNGIQGFAATTNASGSYTISDVPQGNYTLTASANTYQSHTWENVIVTANATTSVWDYYLPHSWSKIGIHSQFNITEDLGADRWGYARFLSAVNACGKTCQLVKSVADFAATSAAKSNCPGSLRVGRIIDLPGLGDLQGYDWQWKCYTGHFDHPGDDPYIPNPYIPADWAPDKIAWKVYYGTAYPTKGTSGLKAKWELNPSVNVWEITNEWDAHYDYQADFFLALMDLAEADGYRIATFSSSYGTPSLDPTYVSPYDTRTVRENVARVCARAKAHGGHMLALHEYAPDGTLHQWYIDHGDYIVTRYRKWHDYLKTYNDPSMGYIGADCPIIITECSNNGGGTFIGDQALINDMAWYDSMVRQDSYLLGVATWNFGHQGGQIADADASTALDEFAAYICGN